MIPKRKTVPMRAIMKKIHYAWAICFVGTMLIFCNIGLCSNILSVYLPFIEETGIGQGEGSSILSIRCAFSFIATFFVTGYYARISLRKGAAAATLLGAAAFAVFSLANGNLALYYLGAVIAGIAYGLGSIIPMSILINNWFIRHKGLAIGICTAGSGAANMIFPPLVTSLVLEHGIRTAFIFQAVFMAVCALAVFLIARDRPEKAGLLPYGYDPACRENNNADDTHTENVSVHISKEVWFALAVMMLLCGGTGLSFSGHLSVLTVTAGYDEQTASWLMSVFGALLIVGKLSFGGISDHIGSKKTSVLFMLAFMAGTLPVMFMDGNTAVFCFLTALLLGFGASVFNMGPPLWSGAFASKKDYPKMLRWLQIFYNLGGIIFNVMPGIIAEHTGEYKSSYVIFTCMMAASLIILLSVYKKQERQKNTL